MCQPYSLGEQNSAILFPKLIERTLNNCVKKNQAEPNFLTLLHHCRLQTFVQCLNLTIICSLQLIV